jgi:WD40 repeat protein
LTGHKAAIFTMLTDADDRHVWTGGGDGWVVRWDLDAPDLGRLVADVKGRVFSMAMGVEDGSLLLGDMDGGVHWVFPSETGRNQDLWGHRGSVFAVLRSGEHVFTAGGDGKLTRWHAESCRATESLTLSHRSLRCLAVSPERREMAVGGSDASIYLLDLDTLALRQVIRDAHIPSVFCLAYSPGGNWLVSGGRDAHIRIWSPDGSGGAVRDIPAHLFTVNSLCFHPVWPVFASGSRDKTIRIWDTDGFRLVKVLEGVRDGGHFHSVNTLVWARGGTRLISGSDDRTAVVWEVSG